jgi:hypothetical protein
MTTLEEIIQQQQELIEQYRVVVKTHGEAQEKLYQYINQIHKLLLTNDPVSKEVAIDHIGKLAAKAKQ